VHGRRLAADRRGKFVEDQGTWTAVRGQDDFFAPFPGVEIKAVRRLPQVTAVTAHDRQAEERLERRRGRNRFFRAVALGRDLVNGARRRAGDRNAVFLPLRQAPFADIEAKLRPGQAAVAVIDGGGHSAIGELQVSHVCAD
jgi:hypothetical protein